MLSNHKIGFIGGGNMAEAILKGMLAAGVNPASITIAEPTTTRREILSDRYKVNVSGDNADVARKTDIIILAIKPQVSQLVLSGLKETVTNNQLVISIMAGIRIATIEAALNEGCRIIRVMPNTPALIGAGATAISGGSAACANDLDMAEHIFSLAGFTVQLEEKLMDAVTALSGSGPAFVCAFIEALADAGVKCGLSRDIATKLAVHTVLGTSMMVHETGDHPALLREQVTSPAGTTIAGLHALELGAFKGTVMNAVDAACQRSIEMGAK